MQSVNLFLHTCVPTFCKKITNINNFLHLFQQAREIQEQMASSRDKFYVHQRKWSKLQCGHGLP